MSEALKPLRYSPKEAASLLGVDVVTVRKWIYEGRFDPLRPNGKGHGRRVYIRADELAAYADAGWDAVKSLRAAKAKKK